MPPPSLQAPAAVAMVRPHHFHPNPETAADNAFQRPATAASVAAQAHAEVTEAAARLEAAGVRVHLFDSHDPATPDAVFPNNWFSTHAGGHVALYPMYAANRRRERRSDIIEMLKARYRVQDVIDYSEPVDLLFMGYVAPQKQWMQGANRSRAGGPARTCNAADAAFARQPFGQGSKPPRSLLPALPRLPAWAAAGA